MKLSSSAQLATELRDPEVRQHTVASQIRVGVPFQLRGMREKRGWTQATVAEKLRTTQNAISRLENPKTSKPTITTLLKLANVYDVGLLVRFCPFGFYADAVQAMDETHIEVPSYDEEFKAQEEAELAHASIGSGIDSASQTRPSPQTNVPSAAEPHYKGKLFLVPTPIPKPPVGCLIESPGQAELSPAQGGA